MDSTNNLERFISLCSKVERDGMEKLMEWLESSDAYRCPASTRYHGSYSGGWIDHALNVYDETKRLLSVYPEIQVSEPTIIITSLFHDLCKVNFYSIEQKNRKNSSGVWEKYDAYVVDEKFCFGGHGSKSVYLLQHFIQLTPEEAVAINCHMGAFDNPNVGKSYEQFPYAWVLHVADEASTYVKEKEKENK